VWLLPRFGELALDRIRTSDVEELMASMRRAKVGAKSIRNYVGTLGAIYRYAMHPKRRWATENPVAAVELPPVAPKNEIRFLTVLEIDALVAAAASGEHQQLDPSVVRDGSDDRAAPG
jgi:site-specific recombinase XerD